MSKWIWFIVLVSACPAPACVAGEGAGVADRRRTQVWELPKGSEAGPDKRDGWKPAAAGEALPGGAAFENDRLLVVVQPDSSGAVIHSKIAGAPVRVEVGLVGTDDKAGKIGKVAVSGKGADDRALVVTAGRAEVELKLKPGEAFVEFRPVRDARAVSVRSDSRFAVMPDFFAMDVAYDARRVKAEKVTALADNFYLLPIDGGSGMVFCTWPGADPKEAAREESVVELFAAGTGEARKFAESRAFFPGTRPVYVALLGGANCWRFEDVGSRGTEEAFKIGWKRPFEARWRATFLTKDEKVVRHWNVSIMSFCFPDPKKYNAPGGYFDEMIKSGMSYRDGMPQGNTQGVIWGYVHPCWFKGDETYLYLWRKTSRNDPPLDSKFESVIVYPLDRAKDTPLKELTLADIMLGTLGVGPCEYILDKEGAVWAYHGGDKKMHYDTATCAIWDAHLSPLLKEWKGKGGRLDAEKEQQLLWMIEDMGTFVAAVNKRIHAYDGFRQTVKRLCEEARQKGGPDAALTASIGELVKGMEKWPLGDMGGFDKRLAEWQGRLGKMAVLAKGADGYKPELEKIEDIRDYAESQDCTIAGCRRTVNVIRQRAGLAVGESGAGSAGLAAKIREECRKVLRNPHPLEHF